MSAKLDNLDIKLLQSISDNARKPFLEIARETGVSGAAIHQRVGKLVQADVIIGAETIVSPTAIGLNTMAFVGVIIKDSSRFNDIVEQLEKVPEIVECYYTTGQYDMILKVYARNNEHLLEIIQGKIQALDQARTVTNIALHEAFRRQPPIEKKNID